MGLVETKLAIIPGGGMSCSCLSLRILGLFPDAGGSGVKGRCCAAVHPAESLLSICVACVDCGLGVGPHSLALCGIVWSIRVSLLGWSPYRITAGLKLLCVDLNMCTLSPECLVKTLCMGGNAASSAQLCAAVTKRQR